MPNEDARSEGMVMDTRIAQLTVMAIWTVWMNVLVGVYAATVALIGMIALLLITEIWIRH